MDKTEREFYLALKHFMHRARKIGHMSPPYIARQMSTTQGVYLAYEMGVVPITAYQLYLFMQITGTNLDMLPPLFND